MTTRRDMPRQTREYPRRELRGQRATSSVVGEGEQPNRIIDASSTTGDGQQVRRVRREAPTYDRTRRTRNPREDGQGQNPEPESSRQESAPRVNRRPMPAYARKISRWRWYGVSAFALLMIAGGLIGMLFPVRPSFSAAEKRDLTPFPEVQVSTFLDGSFFSDLSLWFSDTYPLREPLVQLDRKVDSLFGIQASTQMIGGNVQADELPPEGQTVEVERPARDYGPVDEPTERIQQEEIQSNIMNGLYVDGDKACSMYYFDQYSVQTYCDAVNSAADRLDGIATVYSVLIPNNSGATLDEDTLLKLGASDQQQALRYFHSLMNEKVQIVETYDILRAHRDEYIYFRTDHHWTQLGAYYAYTAFCQVKGIEPSDITKWKQVDYEPFLGSFYQELQLQAMADNPDTVHAYIPTGTNDLVYWSTDGEEFEGNVIADASIYDENSKYMCFIEGDQQLAKIENPKVDDDSSCLVIKDSYGCAFVPNLVDNYHTIYIMDTRKYEGDIPEFVYNNGIHDVIFMNNMTIAGTTTVAEHLYNHTS